MKKAAEKGTSKEDESTAGAEKPQPMENLYVLQSGTYDPGRMHN